MPQGAHGSDCLQPVCWSVLSHTHEHVFVGVFSLLGALTHALGLWGRMGQGCSCIAWPPCKGCCGCVPRYGARAKAPVGTRAKGFLLLMLWRKQHNRVELCINVLGVPEGALQQRMSMQNVVCLVQADSRCRVLGFTIDAPAVTLTS
jgi:hypothetical protein